MPGDRENTYPVEQTRLGLGSACPQLVLLPEIFDIDDIKSPAYAEFVANLQKREREANQLEIVRAERSQMLAAIKAKKKKILEQRAEQQKAAEKVAFIDLHVKDANYSVSLIDYLGQRRFTPLTIFETELRPRGAMSLFEENLKRSLLFIIVFGSVAREWVTQRLNEAHKLIASSRLPTKIGVYVAPPIKSPNDLTFSGDFVTMLNVERFDPYSVETLMKKVMIE